MKKLFTGFIISVLLSNITLAQTYEHFTSWSRLAVNKKFSEHWEMNAELHWRRQNDFNNSSPNPLSLRLAEGYRISAVYRIKEMAFSFAPIIFHTYPLYAKNSDVTKPVKWELRPTFYAEWTKVLSEKWTFRSRLGYEYRLFQLADNSLGDEQGRARLRLQLRYNINKLNLVYISEEPLYNVAPNVPANSFSQNQIYFAYNHTFTPHFSAEIGYMWNHRQRATLVEFDEENVLQTHLLFKL